MKLTALAVLLAACNPLGDDGFTVSGRVVVDPPKASARFAPADVGRTITHVMAVNPETARPQRLLTGVDGDGNFKLDLEVGKPYVLVFVDASAVGSDMAVSVFRIGTLDTVSPQLAGHLELGDTNVDAMTGEATSAIPYTDLLASLGLSADAAEYLGAIDDLSLRYANPDIDGDGVIDIEQDREYALDFHVRGNLRRGSSTGPELVVNDITDRFPDDAGADVAYPDYNLASIYTLYPASFDSTEYVAAMGSPGTGLQNGGVFRATHADASQVPENQSFSPLAFGDVRGWGPDYDLLRTELPGSGGSPATLAFTLGGIGKTLTFTNVVTKSRSALTTSGTLAIFVQLHTTGGTYSSIEYRWMKRTADETWVLATAEEIALTIGSDGGYVSVHRMPSWHDEFGVTIPAQPTGSIDWSLPTTGPDDICGLAVSYDDKLGLRHFIGGAQPNPGVTCAP